MGLDSQTIDSMVKDATEELHGIVNDIVESAVREAEDYGSSIGAEEFLAQIKLNVNSGYLEISTDSGMTDFSQPAYPMLPWLLKNAKVSKDGTRYAVIPVGGSSSSSKPRPQARDISAGLNAMSQGSSSSSAMAEEMANAFRLGSSSSITERQRSASTEKPEFRTASSKQDPTKQWVLPPKSLDMTGTLMTINATIRSEIDKACNDLTAKYEKEARRWLG